MDPNQNLTDLIVICERWEEWGSLDIDPVAAMDRLTELFLALDDWIAGGGFIPDRWR